MARRKTIHIRTLNALNNDTFKNKLIALLSSSSGMKINGVEKIDIDIEELPEDFKGTRHNKKQQVAFVEITKKLNQLSSIYLTFTS